MQNVYANNYFKSLTRIQAIEVFISIHIIVYLWSNIQHLKIISDCTTFTLFEHRNKKVNGTSAAIEIPNVLIGECYLACFNQTGCYTFSYNDNTQTCQLFTDCGSSCVLIDDGVFKTYVRQCGIKGRKLSGVVYGCRSALDSHICS